MVIYETEKYSDLDVSDRDVTNFIKKKASDYLMSIYNPNKSIFNKWDKYLTQLYNKQTSLYEVLLYHIIGNIDILSLDNRYMVTIRSGSDIDRYIDIYKLSKYGNRDIRKIDILDKALNYAFSSM